MSDVDWIGLDWGTTHMRAYGIDTQGNVVRQGESDKGMAVLAPEAFEGALLDVVGGWLVAERVTDVVACGMVGARQGWVEAAYRAVPAFPVGGDFTRPPVADSRLSVRIVAGLCQYDPPDVMRGEETQIAGVVARHGGDGIVCLPGTHSKWAILEGGAVIGFRSEMTGEMFALLCERSVLRHSVDTGDWDDGGFEAGVAAALEGQPTVLSRLFGLRAGALVSGLAPGVARARLSGLLIGAEIAAMRDLWQAQVVAVVGASRLAALYEKALGIAGGRSVLYDAREMTLAGLAAARAAMGDKR